MGAVLTEDELEFDFTQAIKAERLDDETQKLSHCMKSVDFYVEWPYEFWFIEIKNPEHTKIPLSIKKKELKKFLNKISSETLFSNELGPKIKDSFLYLYLMNRLPQKTIKYYVLIAIQTLDPALLLFANDRLKSASCLLGPDQSAWPNAYVDGIGVFNEETWNDYFTQCPVDKT